MKASFIHIADTHLGNEQYGVPQRFNDFSQSFWQILDEAYKRNVTFVVIAGDLFHKRAVDALTLIHAIRGLEKLKQKGIPVLAIEGNHDRSYYRDGVSWLQFLSYQGYLIRLNPQMENGVPQLTHWQPNSMLGSYYDIPEKHIRIYGLPWQGAGTTRSIEGITQTLKEARMEEEAQDITYRLLMMHTGIEGIVPRMQGLPSRSSFEPLHDAIDYLALGHVHKPYEFDGWIYNPGSTETCGAEEAQWEDRGYYYVEIDTEHPEQIIDLSRRERVHHAERRISQRRPFLRYDLRVDGLNEPDELYQKLEDLCRRESARQHTTVPPLVLVSLIGTLGFDAGALDSARMEEMVRGYFNPLYARVDNHTNDQDYVPDEGDIDGRDRSAWHILERRIFEELVGRDNRYQPAREQWGEVLASLKRMAVDKDEPTLIAQFLRGKREELL